MADDLLLPPQKKQRNVDALHLAWEKTHRICDHVECDRAHQGMRSHSFILGFTTLSEEGYHYTQCDEGQHFHCSHDCAKEHIVRCLHKHSRINTPVLRPLDSSEEALLQSGICVLCGDPFRLARTAYFYRITYAMAGWNGKQPHAPIICMDEHWCCSDIHAKDAVAACLREHIEQEPHG